ncbi:MAG: FAD-binding oxidoreductase [Anaerolineae bacterium]|nr:FAD-binding oxidoreductase [Anaerolineae bacterium]
MRIRVLGGGWYGCSIARGLINDGHDVVLHERAGHLFAGASGGNPARLHLGFHYPRSGLTQAACQDHYREFMTHYHFLTEPVPINVYAIAMSDSLVDYRSYVNTLRGKVDFIEVNPFEFGLLRCEGAVLTGERHILIRRARAYFADKLKGHIEYDVTTRGDEADWDMTIDCTFCTNDEVNIDRFEPCVMALLKGPTHKAVTIMDGPFGSIYPWDEVRGLCSLTSAKFTPLSKTCRTWREADETLRLARNQPEIIDRQIDRMYNQMSEYYPGIADYKVVGSRLSIRAMPYSGADTRLVDVVRVSGKTLRVRAGKIDAVFHAERMIKDLIPGSPGQKRENR